MTRCSEVVQDGVPLDAVPGERRIDGRDPDRHAGLDAVVLEFRLPFVTQGCRVRWERSNAAFLEVCGGRGRRMHLLATSNRSCRMRTLGQTRIERGGDG